MERLGIGSVFAETGTQLPVCVPTIDPSIYMKHNAFSPKRTSVDFTFALEPVFRTPPTSALFWRRAKLHLPDCGANGSSILSPRCITTELVSIFALRHLFVI